MTGTSQLGDCLPFLQCKPTSVHPIVIISFLSNLTSCSTKRSGLPNKLVVTGDRRLLSSDMSVVKRLPEDTSTRHPPSTVENEMLSGTTPNLVWRRKPGRADQWVASCTAFSRTQLAARGLRADDRAGWRAQRSIADYVFWWWWWWC